MTTEKQFLLNKEAAKPMTNMAAGTGSHGLISLIAAFLLGLVGYIWRAISE